MSAYFNGPVWDWFGLSYSSYLVLPRTLLCGMPLDWQERYIALIKEAEQTYEWETIDQDYTVHLRAGQGRFKRDPLANYRHPPALPYRAGRELDATAAPVVVGEDMVDKFITKLALKELAAFGEIKTPNNGARRECIRAALTAALAGD